MASDQVVSKIITEFFLNTSQLRQPWNFDSLTALRFCSRIAATRLDDDIETALIPLTTGSSAELYISPMYSCVGDVDIMAYVNSWLAIPAGYPLPTRLPSEFHSCVFVFAIIDSEYPGYVYLVLSHVLDESTDDDKYNARPLTARYFALPPVGHFIPQTDSTGLVDHGPASTIIGNMLPQPMERFTCSIRRDESDYSTDGVYCMRCLSMPPQAHDWSLRKRNYDWPDSATVDRVVSNGCDVVQVTHPRCRQDKWMVDHQWRLSFSRAEVVLLNNWMPVQQVMYHMLRIFTKVERLTDITDSTESKLLSNYNIKTLMLWACELKPRSWWIDDMNVVRICVELLHTLAVWLIDSRCNHYFINTCNLFGHNENSDCAQQTASWLLSITESSLAEWFVQNYIRRCAQLCDDKGVPVSCLFHDMSTSMKLQRVVSEVVDWRWISESADSMARFIMTQFYVAKFTQDSGFTIQSCVWWTRELLNTDERMFIYFTAVTRLHVVYKIMGGPINDELLDILATTCLQSNDVRRLIKARHSSVLSLSQATKLLKVVVSNSRSTVQLIEIELSKAYLYRALRCKDSNNDSIYCLANVYLAVLYYTTGQYQTAIDRCTLVTRSQDHSQCSSHVVQGELLRNIDADIDNVLGLAVFYQYVRTAALNQQQTQHVSVFTTELFAHYLHIRCLSVTECRQFTQTSSTVECQEYQKYFCELQQMFTTDMLLYRTVNCARNRLHDGRLVVGNNRTKPLISCHLDTSKLVDSLQQSAVEHLTTFRQLEAHYFGSEFEVVTTDFESLYAYKRGDYQRCLKLSKHNVLSLSGRKTISVIMSLPEFIQLMDDDITSLTGLTLLVQPSCREDHRCVWISQMSLSLYLMTQCRIKLRHPVTSLAHIPDYIQVARRSSAERQYRFDLLILKLTERKLLRYIYDKLTSQ